MSSQYVDTSARTRDVLRWNFTPWDLMLIAGIATAGCAIGVLDFTIDHLERWVDEVSQ